MTNESNGNRNNENGTAENDTEKCVKSDAKDFYQLLLSKVNKGDAEGCKIGGYLRHVVPDWEKMEPTRLYKHIQKMHENAEAIRRFEIDLIWKRAIYFIPLFVIFFSAFGGVFLISEDNVIAKLAAPELILTLIAFINACLCFFLSKINMESQQWQNNWEQHIDYLQIILGLNMMRVCLRPQAGYFTIGKANTFMSIFMLVIWVGIMSYFLALVWDSYGYFPVIVTALISASSLGFTFLLHSALLKKCFFRKREVKKADKFYIRYLKSFCFDEID